MLEFVLGYSMGKAPATPAPSVAASPTNRIEELNEQLHELALIVSALWSLLERQGLTSDQLIAKLEEFDRIDGTTGHQGGSRLLECPSCHSKVAFGLQNCQFCGTQVRTETGQPLSQV